MLGAILGISASSEDDWQPPIGSYNIIV